MRALMMTLVISTAFAAPAAPVPKELAVPEIGAGDWETTWAGSKWYYTLNADGTCTGRTQVDGTTLYIGWWQWDSKTRRLMLCESRDNWESWVWYSFQFDRGLRSKCIESATTGETDAEPRPVTWTFRSK